MQSTTSEPAIFKFLFHMVYFQLFCLLLLQIFFFSYVSAAGRSLFRFSFYFNRRSLAAFFSAFLKIQLFSVCFCFWSFFIHLSFYDPYISDRTDQWKWLCKRIRNHRIVWVCVACTLYFCLHVFGPLEMSAILKERSKRREKEGKRRECAWLLLLRFKWMFGLAWFDSA